MYNRIPFNHSPHISHIFSHRNGANLWLGDHEAATDPNLLRRLSIRSVMTVADELRVAYSESEGIDHLVLRVPDMPSYRIRDHFAEANKFIYESLAGGRNVLVHCARGISRSVTIIMAFLINKLKFDFKKAQEYVKTRRSIANPNYGFVQELKFYEHKMYSKRNGSLRIESEPSPNSKYNEVSSLITELREQQRRKLRQAFQSNYRQSKASSSLVISAPSSKYLSEKAMSQEKNSVLQKRRLLVRRMTQISDTVQFPKIILVKKLEQLESEAKNNKRS